MGKVMYDDPLMQETAARRRDWNYLLSAVEDIAFSKTVKLYNFGVDKTSKIKPKNIEHVLVNDSGEIILTANCRLEYLVKMVHGEEIDGKAYTLRDYFLVLHNNWNMQGKNSEDFARIARTAYQLAAHFEIIGQKVPSERMLAIADFVNPYNNGREEDITKFVDVEALRSGAIDCLIQAGDLDVRNILALKKAAEHTGIVTIPGSLTHNYELAQKAVEDGARFTVKEYGQKVPIRARFIPREEQQ